MERAQPLSQQMRGLSGGLRDRLIPRQILFVPLPLTFSQLPIFES